jgi:ribulose-5-phosphate 4-epimerase/fuculose-1-phosphate aldolase
VSHAAAREAICRLGHSLYARGLTFGSSGNISVAVPDGWLMTPTNVTLGDLDPARLSHINTDGSLIAGEPPTKEAFLHRVMYEGRPDAGAVVHLHSTQATAVSCLPDVDQANPIPPLTPYFVMRVGRSMPIIPYYRPGDPAMEPAISQAAKDARAVLLANHGPVVSGKTLTDAVYAAEELEEAAKLFLMLRGQSPRLLGALQVDDLLTTFG